MPPSSAPPFGGIADKTHGLDPEKVTPRTQRHWYRVRGTRTVL